MGKILLLVTVMLACSGDSGADATPNPCSAYCSTITGACTGANSQYGTQASCLASCEAYPAGAVSDQSGHSLACRSYHAGVAVTAASVHCPHAGPGGAGVCGTDCEGFCAIVQDACTGANSQYADATACMSACSGFATDVPYSVGATGNNLACRLYHATIATTDPATHCGHTAVVSSVCR